MHKYSKFGPSGLFTLELHALIAEKTIFDLLGMLDSGEQYFHLQIPVFRCVDSSSGVQPNPYGTYAVPRDFIDIASGEDPSKLMDLLHLVKSFLSYVLSFTSQDEM